MTVEWISLAFVLCVLGLAGCVVVVLPGPILAYAGLLCLLMTDATPSLSMLIVFGAATAFVTVLDYVVPVWGARMKVLSNKEKLNP